MTTTANDSTTASTDNTNSTNANDNNNEDDSTLLIKLYMRANQAAYAIVAFPIGTVLSIGPIYLFQQSNVSDIQTIGYLMTLGEFVGILCMKLAEHSKQGFVLSRPYDLYFIIMALALFLILIPIWPLELWYLSGFCIVMVQTFNSSSKPVVSESIHRLAILTESEPNTIFAQANMWRRVGNAMIGGMTPLLYALFPMMSFYLIGGVILLYLVFCIGLDVKIKSICKDVDYNREETEHSEADIDFSRRLSSLSREFTTHSSRSLSNRTTTNNNTNTNSKTRTSMSNNRSFIDNSNNSKLQFSFQSSISSLSRSSRRGKRSSTISMLSSYKKNSILSLDCEAIAALDEIDNTNPNDQTATLSTGCECIDSEFLNAIKEDDESQISLIGRTPSSIELGGNDPIDNRAESKRLTRAGSKRLTKSVSFRAVVAEVCSEQGGFVENGEDERNATFAKAARDIRRSSLLGGGDIESRELSLPQHSTRSQTNVPAKRQQQFDTLLDNYSYLLIVYAFPFFDAVITRLPFAYLTIAVWETTEKVILSSAILFGYQIGRAISQQIQVWRCDTIINYGLNLVAFSSYLGFVIYTEAQPQGNLWFVFLLFTGFSETLPIQQLYLLGLFGSIHEDEMGLRNAVKSSHTFTGFGSMAAFLVGSQIYGRFKVQGTAYLGLGVMVLKLVTNIQIDYLHTQKEKKTKIELRKRREAYSDLFSSLQFGDAL